MLLIPPQKRNLSNLLEKKKIPKKITNFFGLKKCQNLLKKKSLLPMKEGRKERIEDTNLIIYTS